MKTKSLFITVLLSMFLQAVPAQAAGWVDDWLQQKTSTSPNYFEGQKRGYFTGGSMNARWYSSHDYPVTLSNPKLKFGCGGIDAYAGGLSFLNDPNYLQNKLQAILSNASAAAFDMALSTLCEQCSTAIKDMESLGNKLNSMQLDDCAIGKDLVATIAGKPNATKKRAEGMMAYLTGTSQQDNPDKVKQSAGGDGGTDPTSDAEKTSGCPADLKEVFMTPGSTFLQALGAKKNVSSAYLDLMRGFIGDIRINTTGGAKPKYVASPILPCEQNKHESPENFIVGNAFIRPADGSACVPASDTNLNLVTYASTKLTGYASKYKLGVVQDAETLSFVNSVPLPLRSALNAAVATEQENVVITSMSRVVARAYAYGLMADMYGKALGILFLADEIEAKGRAAYGPECQTEIITPQVVAQMRDLVHNTYGHLTALRSDYARVMAEENSVISLAERYEKVESGAKSESKSGLVDDIDNEGGTK